MDVLQLSHTGSVRALCRLIRGTDRPVVVTDGVDEVMVVLSPSAFEAVLLRGGREGRAGRGVFGGGGTTTDAEAAWGARRAVP